ncbi:MAG TPA: succinate dehydrogenase, cytochrome b556 subunit [Steroidobacteraceae bacterium]|nr:succinate dehydrogenase, cytochrome b556 subunit [Steroidobacteraceae bacterium]
MATRSRPLSPHLQIYRPTHTMVLSVLHRATGLVLALGLLLFAAWLLALAAGPLAYTQLTRLLASPPGRLLLVGFLFAYCYHFTSGIRHLVFDTGRGLERRAARHSAWLVVVVSLALAALSLWAMLRVGGSP